MSGEQEERRRRAERAWRQEQGHKVIRQYEGTRHELGYLTAHLDRDHDWPNAYADLRTVADARAAHDREHAGEAE